MIITPSLFAHKMPTSADALPLCERCGWGGQYLEPGPGWSPARVCSGPYTPAEQRRIVRMMGLRSCVELGCGSHHVPACPHFDGEIEVVAVRDAATGQELRLIPGDPPTVVMPAAASAFEFTATLIGSKE